MPSTFGKRIKFYYDPRGQVVRTVNPDGSEQRVLFGIPDRPDLLPPNTYSNQNLTPTPWESYNYDANDLAPLTHPTGSGVPVEHHYSPKSVKVDALGRTIKTIDRLSQSAADEVVMRYKFDIRGNLIEVKDALATPRIVFTHVYDLKPKTGKDDPGANVLKTFHLDSGTKTALFDAAFKPVELKDEKGSHIMNAYDALNRPIKVWAIDNAGESFKQRQYLQYGDNAGLTNPQNLNLRGKLYRHYDEAGMAEMAEYDFKGNVLEKKRQVIKDSEILSVFSGGPPFQCYRVQWDPGVQDFDTYAGTLLDSANTHQISTEYDALNRAIQITYPEDYNGDQKVIQPTYNRAGALEKVLVDGTTYVEHIAYNVKGQRLLIAFHAVMTRYTYDKQTFRLKRIRSETYTSTPGSWEFDSAGNVKQDTVYDYDLAGNIVATTEKTTGCGVGGTNLLEREFDYDPLYRLLRATGRENSPTITPIWDDSYRSNDSNTTSAYAQNYVYDKMGNILKLQHLGNNNFTRVFNPDGSGNPPVDYGSSNLLNEVKIGATTYDFLYDDNGNLKQENAGRFYEWDYEDRMRCFYIDDGTTITKYAHYLYDAQGNRVKKLVRNSAGTYESITYVDGIFEYRTDGTNEQNIAHIMDDKSRIAMLRTGNAFGDTTPDIKYIIEDHLGSSVFELEYDGTNIDREEYYPFGETSYASYQKKRYKYCGKEKDEESGLYYYGARYYSAWCCRFVSIDPLSMKTLDFSGYAYANDNPLIYHDPSGKQAVKANDKEPAESNISTYQWSGEDTTKENIKLETGDFSISRTEGKDELTSKHRELFIEAEKYKKPEGVKEYSDWKAVLSKADKDYLIEFKDQWVKGYKNVIKDIAEKENIPAELLGMTAWTEVGGSPPSEDLVVFYVRELKMIGGPPEKTSFGNLQMQIRTAAELLGYNPNELTLSQSYFIIRSLENNVQNIMLAAKYLKGLVEVDWGNIDPKAMTKEQVMLTSLRYSRGPSPSLNALGEALKKEPYKSTSYNKMKKLFSE